MVSEVLARRGRSSSPHCVRWQPELMLFHYKSTIILMNATFTAHIYFFIIGLEYVRKESLKSDPFHLRSGKNGHIHKQTE